ncbi:MAG: 6-bladed beta-propeller [Armatimonadetes bacterium]|nr:6-bladed beta-propeller [Armatimonadota bacterium]NIO75524.1 6-bladed beta-propeller [Armatimonadota bacterium]NIO95901.1 6-bladed beta-propeller [Armatimonadota bacterium]
MIFRQSDFLQSRCPLLVVCAVAAVILLAAGGCKQELQAPPKFLFSIESSDEFALDSPEGISISTQGEIIIADTGQDRILKMVSEKGGNKPRIEQIWGGFGTDPGQLSAPSDVAVDPQGNIYVSDTWNHRVQSFSPEGRLLKQWGKKANVWDPKDDELFYPKGITIDSDMNIYVVDTPDHRIVKYLSQGGKAQVLGEEGKTSGRFHSPLDVAAGPSENLYVSDTGNNRVQELDLNGDYRNKWGTEGSEPGQFKRPSGVAADAEARVYVVDSGNHRVQVFDASGDLITMFGKRGNGPGEFESPESIAVGPEGKICVLDWGNNRIQVFQF